MTPSTRGGAKKPVNWLFFHPVNRLSEARRMTIPGYSLDAMLEELDWAAELKRFFNFRAGIIHFWQPKDILLLRAIPHDWISTSRSVEDVADRCQPITTVNEALEESWDPKHIHFLITAEESTRDEDLAITAERGDTMSELPLQIMIRRHDEAKITRRPSASKAVRSKEYASLQGNPCTVIYNGCFACDKRGGPKIITVAPPIQVFHPIFQEFSDRINDPGFEPDAEVVTHVLRLMSHSSQIHVSEDAALTETRKILSDLLGVYVGQVTSRWTRTPDGVVCRQDSKRRFPLVVFEYKRAIGEGGCDPSLQAAYSLQDFLYKDELGELINASCCPAFLLGGAGPHLFLYGAIHTDKFMVQHIANVYLGEATTHEDTKAYQIAKFFTSLRRALKVLDGYYQGILDSIISPVASTTPRRCFFPYPTKFREHQTGTDTETEFTEFEYTDVPNADPTNVTFFANVKSPDRELVVKFVDRYGVKAHELLVEAGMAPPLLYCGTLDGENDVRSDTARAEGRTEHGLYVGPLRMVVMERITHVQERDAWPEDAHEQVERAINTLHRNGLVFGDLRPPNVLFSCGKVFLIDFDWAGEIKEARYPHGLSTCVDWPAAAVSLERQPIIPDHDICMLEKLFPSR